MTIRDNRDYIKVLVYYTTITGWGVLLYYRCRPDKLLREEPSRLLASTGFIGIILGPIIMENQMEKKMEHEMETGII